MVVVRNPLANEGDIRESGSIPRLGRSTGGGKGYSLQYSDLENSMDCIVHGVAKSWVTKSWVTKSWVAKSHD